MRKWSEPKDWKRSVFIPIPKKGNGKECLNYCTIVLISHASKIMLKILQARCQQCVNWELPDVQAGFRKGRGTRDQIASICWITEKATEFQKNICFITMLKALTVWITTNCGIVLKIGKTRLSYLPPENLYAGQEAIGRNRHRITDWLKIAKGV